MSRNEHDKQGAMAANIQRDKSRHLYFHTGTHKTGSTALQKYLHSNQEVLETHFISYLFQGEPSDNSANGLYMFSKLDKRILTPDAMDEMLENYMGRLPVAICSAEDFTQFGVEEWKQIYEGCLRLNLRPKFIVFLRDVIPYYYSVYGEFVKNGLVASTFEEFCAQDWYKPIVNSMRIICEIFGRDAISVFHYESEKEHMGSVFIGSLGQCADDLDDSILNEKINRSLSDFEMELLLRVNKSMIEQYSRGLSLTLIEKRPNLKRSSHCNANLVEILIGRHQEDVLWMNEMFFEARPILNVVSRDFNLQKVDQTSDAVKLEIAFDAIEWCARQLSDSRAQAIQFVVGRIRSASSDIESESQLPSDFDPVAYLLLNPDVLFANVDATWHFINYGKQEGRLCSFNNKANMHEFKGRSAHENSLICSDGEMQFLEAENRLLHEEVLRLKSALSDAREYADQLFRKSLSCEQGKCA